MVDQNDGVAVGDQIVHHTGQAHDIRRVQADGRLVKHIEDAGRAVAHCAGQLHPLALTGRERRSRAVQRQIAQSEVHQALGRALECFANTLSHWAHLLRQAGRHTLYPLDELCQRHGTGLIQRNAPQPRRAGRARQTRAVTIRADILFQKLFHSLHALFVLDLGKSIFYGVNGVEVGKIQITGLPGILIVIENVLFLRRAVEHDVLLPLRQFAERHIRAHAHLAADIRHQGPHQAVPRGNRTLVDGQGLIRHKRRHINGVHHARAAALLARALRVECQLLGRRSIKMHAARRADELLPGRDEQRRGQIMAIRAAVAGKAGIHQAQTVQKLRSRAERAADARHAGALVQGQCGRYIQHLVHAGPRCLRHAAAGIGGQGLEIAARAFGIQHAQRQRRLAGPGHACDPDDFSKWNIDVNIFQVVDLCSTDQHLIDHVFHSGFFSYTAAGIARPLHPFRPRSGGKVRVLIKADRLRVDRQLPDAVMPHGTFQHLPAKTHAAFVCRKEQHL